MYMFIHIYYVEYRKTEGKYTEEIPLNHGIRNTHFHVGTFNFMTK